MATEIDPLEVLREDLQDESVEVQLEAIGALSTIAIAMGPDRTAGELYKALEKYCFPVQVQAAQSAEAYSNTEALAAKEEVLAAIAEALTPDFIDYSGGSEQAAKYMLPLLQKLAMVEETVIRQNAVVAINNLFLKLKSTHVQQYGLPMLKHLSEGDWFSNRCSASGLTWALYRRLEAEADRRTILDTHERLCKDDMPMVKNEAYKNLVKLVSEMKNMQLIKKFTQPLLEMLSKELMESMRQIMVDIVKILAEKSEEEKSQEVVVAFLKETVEDDSWRVRKHCALALPEICSHIKDATVTEFVCPMYIKLLADSEPQVRRATISVLEKVLECSKAPEFAKKLVNGPIQTVAGDSVSEVREALAEQIAALGKYLSDSQKTETFLPVLRKLASDDSPHARLNLCSKLSGVSEILGIDVFEAEILPLLKEVTIDQRWRVRNSIVENIAHIGVQMGKDKFGKSRLKDILIQSLKDPAATVRETASKQVQILHEAFGFEWMASHLFEPMKAIYNESGNYLHRMVPLKAVQLMAPKLQATQIRSDFSVLLSSALDDPISNVRFTACRVLEVIIPSMDASTVATFKSRLEKLSTEDGDPDVIYFAKQALKKCSS